jgi:hypothetical protein
MRRSSFAVLLVLASLSLGGTCGGADHTSGHLDMTGTWDVYRTYPGEPERGPDAAALRSVPGGYGVEMHFVCSSHLLPAGHVDIAGELRDSTVTLGSPDATWVGAVSGSTISGTFADPRGAGTWRAVKVPTATCKTYEVWGGTVDLGCGSPDDPEQNGYTLLGAATATHAFVGQYPWYYVVTRDFHQVRVDSVETTPGTFPGAESTSNVDPYLAAIGAPDGTAATVGAGRMSGDGLLRIGPETATTTVTVYLLP